MTRLVQNDALWMRHYEFMTHNECVIMNLWRIMNASLWIYDALWMRHYEFMTHYECVLSKMTHYECVLCIWNNTRNSNNSKWRIHKMLFLWVQNDAFIRITCLVHTGDITYECVPWLIQTDLVFESKELLIEHQVLFFEMPLHLYILYI